MTNQQFKQLGNYQLLHVLGQGGCGTVYLAEHIYLKTRVAIKVLQLNTIDHEEGFLITLQAVAHLDHPHIVRILECGFEGQRAFIVMEYAPHGTLRQRHPVDASLSLASIVCYVKQIATALDYAHTHQVIHQDLKPENILLGLQHDLLLSDFGIAQVTHRSRLSSTIEVAGTVTYMAPEQFLGKPQPASDQYALGIMVYEWLCGDRPFHGTFAEMATQHALVSPPSLCEQLPSLSAEVEQVVLTALAKEPAQRFASVQIFANALEHACLRTRLLPRGQRATTHAVLPGLRPSRRTLIKGLVGLLAGGGLVGAATWLLFSPIRKILVSFSGVTHPSPPRGTTFATYAVAAVAVAWSPHNGDIALGTRGGVQLWNRTTGVVRNITTAQDVFVVNSGLNSQVYEPVAWSPDGTRIAVGSVTGSSPNTVEQVVQVYNSDTGKQIRTYPDYTQRMVASTYVQMRVIWSPNGTHIASGGYNYFNNLSGSTSLSEGTVQVWNIQTGENTLIYREHTDGVNTVAWSPNSMFIASGDSDFRVQVWNATTGDHLFIYNRHLDEVTAVAWSPTGQRIASGSGDNSVQVWDAMTGDHVLEYRGHAGPITAVVWSPDGRYIASGSSDATIQVWDPLTGKRLYTYDRHASSVTDVAWSPDSQRIVSAGENVRIWQAV